MNVRAALPYNSVDAHAAGANRRELRRCRKGARALSSRAESADGRDRKRQIDRGGCAGAAAGRARRGRNGAQRRGAGAHLGNLRSGRRKALPEGVEPEDGELIIEREILPNGKSRAFAGGRPVTAALLKELARQPGRYPRPARSAAVVFGRRPAGNAGRVRGRRRAGGGSRVALLTLERGNGRNWPNSTAPRRKSCARPTCGVFSATKSRP